MIRKILFQIFGVLMFLGLLIAGGDGDCWPYNVIIGTVLFIGAGLCALSCQPDKGSRSTSFTARGPWR